MPDEPRLHITRRNLPHWQLEGIVYFVTYRLLRGTLTGEERRLVLDHLHEGEGRFYMLFIAVVMPDHVHLLLKLVEGFDLSRVMKGIKETSARRINQGRNVRGSLWQDESYDRIMRTEEEFHDKVRYVLDNPVRAELVERSELYEFAFCNREATFGPTCRVDD
jgi:putative transposase